MLLKSRASLACFRACFLPGRAKDLSASLYYIIHFNNIETRAVIKFSFFLQGKAPKEIHAILTETLACFLPGRAKDLSASLYYIIHFNNIKTRAVIKFSFFLQGKAPKEIHAILTETLACFLPGRAKDLSAPLYTLHDHFNKAWSVGMCLKYLICIRVLTRESAFMQFSKFVSALADDLRIAVQKC